jgi:hypothetical protein
MHGKFSSGIMLLDGLEDRHCNLHKLWEAEKVSLKQVGGKF